jgi:hypothetical protein
MTATRPDFPESIEDRLPTEETADLIASDKVEGTAVFDGKGDKIGTIENFMVDKRSGQVVYAVMSFGGFLGMGEKHHPLPWKVLRYDEKLGGFSVGLDMDKIKHGPSYDRGREPAFNAAYYGSVYGYYGI